MADSAQREDESDHGSPSGLTATRDEVTPPDSLTGMFSQLLTEMKSINSGIASLHEARQFDEEVDEEALLNDDDGEGSDEKRDIDVESLDTRVDKLVDWKKPASNPDILASIAQDFAVNEKTSAAVNDNLAGIVSSLLNERLADDKLKQKLQNYPRPENIEGLKTPRINPLIWGQISANTQQCDAKSQKTQHVLIGAVSAIVKATDHVLKNDNSDKELITMLTDAMAFVLQCNHDQNYSRRLSLKKDLHKDFAALCSVNTPSGDYLFGDLSKLTKEISDANKLAKKVRPAVTYGTGRNKRSYSSNNNQNRNQRKFQPYPPNQRGKNPFFDKGRFPAPRKKGNSNKY